MSHLVPLHSSLDSSQPLFRSNPYWTGGWRCCFCWWTCSAGLSHSEIPSRLSHRRRWLSGGHRGRRRSTQCWMQWTLTTRSVLPPLVSSASAQGCQDSWQGSLGRWLHLWWYAVWTQEEGHFNHSPWLPQPSAGQSVECVDCQCPNPVVESGSQVLSMSHRLQQQLTTRGDSISPPSPPS